MHVWTCVFLVVSIWMCVAKGVPVTSSPAPTPDNGQRCTQGSDCPDKMCCVHNPLNAPDHPDKRFIFQEFNIHDHGYCRRERYLKESCFPLGHDFKNPNLYEFHCPCIVGLECRGTVVHESAHQIVHEYPQCQEMET